MAEIALENRVTNLEDMMTRLTYNIDRLGERVDRTSETIDRLGERVDRTAETIDRLGERVDRTSETIDRLGERVDRTSETIDRLGERVDRTSETVNQMGKRIDQLSHRMDQFVAETNASQRRREKSWAETQAALQAEQRRWNKTWGEFANKWGTMIEDLVAPSLPRILQTVVDCPPDESPLVNVRVRRRHKERTGFTFEIDSIADCGDYVLICETKSSLVPKDIDDTLAKLAAFRDYFPEYADHHLLGAVATLYIDASLIQYASRNGLVALAVGQELMDIQNEAGFEPRRF